MTNPEANTCATPGAKNPAKLPLDITFSDQLATTFTPPDELVQDMLEVGGGSVLFGDSNSGKTFFAIGLSAAIALGDDFLGHKTEPGVVLYLAAESPASVQARLLAYQQHHGVCVPNIAIVKNQINLFRDDKDTTAIIKSVRMIEEQYGQKVRLIVGDTLARISAGANENTGQDMG